MDRLGRTGWGGPTRGDSDRPGSDLSEVGLPDTGKGPRQFRSCVPHFAVNLGLRLDLLAVGLPTRTGIAAQAPSLDDQVEHFTIYFLHFSCSFNLHGPRQGADREAGCSATLTRAAAGWCVKGVAWNSNSNRHDGARMRQIWLHRPARFAAVAALGGQPAPTPLSNTLRFQRIRPLPRVGPPFAFEPVPKFST